MGKSREIPAVFEKNPEINGFYSTFIGLPRTFGNFLIKTYTIK